MNQLKYDSLYSGLVSINRSLGGYQPMPDSEYGAMIDLMETLSNRPVGESGDVFDAVSTVATMAENGELPIQGGEVPSGCRLGTEWTTVTSNGSYSWDASNYGLDGFSSFQVDVAVPFDGEKESVNTAGVKFARSTFYTAPDKYRYDFVPDAAYMFDRCLNLESIPADFNFSSIVDGTNAFYGCRSLQSIPSGIYLGQALAGEEMFAATGISTVENFSAPLVEGYADFFSNCPNLTSVNGLSIDKATMANSMFKNCANLRTIQGFSMPNVTQCNMMFQGCTYLESVPLFDTSNVTRVKGMFNGCMFLENIPSMNLSKVTTADNVTGLFFGCTNLVSIGAIDLSGLTQPASIFNTNMGMLTDIVGFIDLSVGFAPGGGLERCPSLSKTSIESIVNNLKDVSSTGEVQVLTLSIFAEDKVDDQIAATAAAKGWQIEFDHYEN